ncbi:MAG: hypothetical protein CMP53_08970 [Flavobacteriales bacterium]|nr:hypothetical protein [Flavobacteriales bacterium]
MDKGLNKNQIKDLEKIIDMCNDDMHEYIQFAYMLNENLSEEEAVDQVNHAMMFVEDIVSSIDKIEASNNLSHMHIAYLLFELHTRGVANLLNSLGVAAEERFQLDYA